MQCKKISSENLIANNIMFPSAKTNCQMFSHVCNCIKGLFIHGYIIWNENKGE